MLHPTVVFIGDKPNPKKNLSMDVPFVGTKSYKTLLEWCYRMDIDVTSSIIINAHTVTGQETPILKWYKGNGIDAKVIALGDNVCRAVEDCGFDLFKLPHPSGMNRELNDKKKLAEKLARCRAWIYKEKR